VDTSLDVAIRESPVSAPLRWQRAVAAVLDCVIALYAFLLTTLSFGGLNLGWLTVRSASKPFLVLLLVVPVRLALGEPRWWSTAGIPSLSAFRVSVSVRDAAFAYVLVMCAITCVGFLANVLFGGSQQRPFSLPFHAVRLAETFAAWDSGWYFDIAQRGYYYSSEGQSSVAFFPLYPLVVRALAWPFGSTAAATWLAGIAVSNGAFFVGLVVVHRWVLRVFGEREVARRTVLYLTVFPFSFFMTRVYPSSLFFLLNAASISAAYSSRWWSAGALGALATLTRPHGVLIGIPVALIALRGCDARTAALRLLALSPVPLALVAYSAFVYVVAGHPLAWLSAQSQWGYSLGHAPWQQLLRVLGTIQRHGLYDYFFTSSSAPFHLFHGCAALFLLSVTPFVFSRVGLAPGAWVLASVIVPLTGSSLEGIGRYGAVLFPVFAVIATVRSTRVHEALLVGSCLLLALFLALFVTWRPIY
jgi:hypothetical protein